MAITMSNEEIRQTIMEHQLEIQKCLEMTCGKFELNPDIAKHKKCIDDLRSKCTHLNTNHEAQTFNGRCVYCGKVLE